MNDILEEKIIKTKFRPKTISGKQLADLYATKNEKPHNLMKEQQMLMDKECLAR